MRKSCHNCEKEIGYYAGFCHHCETKQKYVKQLSSERIIKIYERDGVYRPTKETEEKLDDGTIIKRAYHYGVIGIWSVSEDWEESNGDSVFQGWEGKREKHILTDFTYMSHESDNKKAVWPEIQDYIHGRIDELSELAKEYVEYVFMKKWEWGISRNEVNLHIRDIRKEKRLIRNDKYNIDIIDKDYTEYYMGVFPFNIKLNYIIKDSKCLSGILYSPTYEKLYSIINGNGYMLDELDYCLDRITAWGKTLYYSIDGNLKEYKPYTEEFDYYMNKINKEKEELEKRKAKEKYFSDITYMRENFKSQDYEKVCTDCYEIIKLPAKICRFCKREFSRDEVESAIDKKFREIHPEP